MTKRQSRAIGAFLKELLAEEGIKCSQYPTLTIVRSSPEGQIDLIWTLVQLVQCYQVTDAYLIEAENVEIADETGAYEVDYLSIVLRREEGTWLEPQLMTNIEDIYPNLEDIEKLRERFGRFGEKAKRTILSFVG
jgi:hypothetical protein